MLLGLCKQVELDSTLGKIDKKNTTNNMPTNIIQKENPSTASENKKFLNDSEKNSLDKDDLLKNAESFFQKNENN